MSSPSFSQPLPAQGSQPLAAEHERDHALVRRARGGELASQEQLLDRMACVRRFVHFIDKRAGQHLSVEELEDTIQEAMLAIWRKLGFFEGRSSFETWAYRFCHLEVSTRLRRKFRRPLLWEELEQEDPMVPAGVSRSLEYERLYRSLDILGPPNAEVIRLKHLQALTFEEIGAQLGVSVNTAKTQYYRGMRSLRELYGPDALVPGGEA